MIQHSYATIHLKIERKGYKRDKYRKESMIGNVMLQREAYREKMTVNEVFVLLTCPYMITCLAPLSTVYEFFF